ncbi:hypothetical protein D918_01005 [Trichuris suis]|nr:hypothetical protein D918_01005 [Trichuris suis]
MAINGKAIDECPLEWVPAKHRSHFMVTCKLYPLPRVGKIGCCIFSSSISPMAMYNGECVKGDDDRSICLLC